MPRDTFTSDAAKKLEVLEYRLQEKRQIKISPSDQLDAAMEKLSMDGKAPPVENGDVADHDKDRENAESHDSSK